MPLARSPNNPLITPETHPSLGGNINGPCLVRVPDWVPNPLGRYYLYFAHHQGTFIRMAYADSLDGPYTVYAPGVLSLEDAPYKHHIASPDVRIDEKQRVFTMLYHGCGATEEKTLPHGQLTTYAESSDGLHFATDRAYLAESYLRTFSWDGWHYGFSGGPYRRLSRSRDLRAPFEPGPVLEISGESFTDFSTYDKAAPDAPPLYRTRHVAFHRRGHELDIYYSNVGDAPERIKCTTVDLRPDWSEWRGTRYREVLCSETDYEGAREPVSPSRGGSVHTPVHQVRDPYVHEEDGRLYLVYSIAGEYGLAMAEILPSDP